MRALQSCARTKDIEEVSNQRKMDNLTLEADRILMGRLESETIYMRVYIQSNGEVFPEMESKYKQLWAECVIEAANNLGYL